MKDKKYLNISEVSRRLQIEEHTIRHWDSKVETGFLIMKILKKLRN